MLNTKHKMQLKCLIFK